MFIIEMFEGAQRPVIVTYPGRFQPFHLGHADVFRSLQAKFGSDNVYIVTSNKTNSDDSPFNYSDKLRFMHAAGVPDHNIVESNQPYKLPDQFESRKADIIFITAVGSPDATRLRPGSVKKDGSPSYYQKLPANLGECKTADQHGYVVIADERAKTITVGGRECNVSHGTACRQLWNEIRNKPQQRAEFVKQLYGRADPELAQILDKIPDGSEPPAPKPSPKLKKVKVPTAMEEGWLDKAKEVATWYLKKDGDVIRTVNGEPFTFKTKQDAVNWAIRNYKISYEQQRILPTTNPDKNLITDMPGKLGNLAKEEEDNPIVLSKDDLVDVYLSGRHRGDIVRKKVGERIPNNMVNAYIAKVAEKFKLNPNAFVYGPSKTPTEGFNSKQEVIDHFVRQGKSAASGAAAWERGWRGPQPKKKKLRPPVRSYHDDLDDKRYGEVSEDAAGVGVVKGGNDPRYMTATMGDDNDVTPDTLNQMMRGYNLIGKKSTGKQRPVKSTVGKGINEDLPPPEAARKTQIKGTLPTYLKARDVLDKSGVEGPALDFGAGAGHGTEHLGPDAKSYEPFPQGNFQPHYVDVSAIPSNSFKKIVNLNVLNVVPNVEGNRIRDSIVQNIGRVLAPGGIAIITTRGKDVLTIKGNPGPEPTSMISSIGTYQKGFTGKELLSYIQGVLGSGFEVSALKLGPAGVTIRKTEQSVDESDHDFSPMAWSAKEIGKQPTAHRMDMAPHERDEHDFRHEMDSLKHEFDKLYGESEITKYNVAEDAGGTGAGSVATSMGGGDGFGWSVFYKGLKQRRKKVNK